MKKKALLPLLLGVMVFLAGCDYSKSSNRDGFFYNTFVEPMSKVLHWLGHSVFNDDYGIAIIVLVLVIRIILLPFMLSNYKNSHLMREKMKVAKPEVDGVQEKVKRARTQEEKMAANQEMMEVYKKYDINPMKSALGCLPVLIQMPVVMGLYFVLRYRIGGGIAEHPHFLWFNLIHPDIWITIIAGVLYFIQAWVSSKQMPQEQRQMTYMMMIVSPIMIIWISLSSASALGLYWSVSAAFLVVQTYFANMYYEKVAQREVAPMIEKFKENNSNSNKKGKNTQVVSKNNKKKK
ncbi:membrane protein insertase YidC [Staphylococcus sp. EG-SA-6]|uniref:Membrane protein insertase YidC n=6 Tax=Staphylococcus haemolyticus TaxID=1283 RepID=YIDC_STAHJ|nr:MULTISPECIES: membrane protein insertase YidC [Staphylococcus]Q4L7X2.1 RecName: Full=Membrane protein insertase YidC; AltName: Full=Foldase YidC; AltName: Full=Membrane integrase YidC; AltName: Full=Membrane protein YidC; Flags: Precursor [Staphylococcus haemolyticus JCSC1435]KDP47218.1 60Kd inner membrane protein [Staphylococcus aureus subsp. aureus CO-98]MBN4934902.1 membrane protein insertase YidC [Staphylococcus sp. EG-SA-6]MDU2098325.1 membrane protein insertase YidC [Staphylococcus sp.